MKILDIENDLKMSLFLGFFKDDVENMVVDQFGPEDNDFVNATSSKVFPINSRIRNQNSNGEDGVDSGLLSSTSIKNIVIEDNDAVIWLEKVLMGEQLFDSYPQVTPNISSRSYSQ